MITFIRRELHQRQHLSHAAIAAPAAAASAATALVVGQAEKIPGQPIAGLLPRRGHVLHVEVGHGGAHVASGPHRRRLLEERGGGQRRRGGGGADLEAPEGWRHQGRPVLVERRRGEGNVEGFVLDLDLVVVVAEVAVVGGEREERRRREGAEEVGSGGEIRVWCQDGVGGGGKPRTFLS